MIQVAFIQFALWSRAKVSTFFVKDQIVKYFRHCGPDCLYCNYLTLPLYCKIATGNT